MRNDLLAGKRGIMCHYLVSLVFDSNGNAVSDINQAADGFDVDGFVRQVVESGSSHAVFTFGQNTGLYIAPSETMAKYVGPGHCSRRDLAGEIMEGLVAAGVAFIAYLPCEIRANRSLHEGFAWREEDNTRQTEFQNRYLELVSEWAGRYGKKLSGWWFDGCYTWAPFNNKYLRTKDWMNAARSGNPEAVVAFNDGSFLENTTAPVYPVQDYISGEANVVDDEGWPMRHGRSFRHLGKYANDTTALNHLLLPIDAMWWHGNNENRDSDSEHRFPVCTDRAVFEHPAFGADELSRVLENFCGCGASVTFNVGIRSDGLVNPESVELLSGLKYSRRRTDRN